MKFARVNQILVILALLLSGAGVRPASAEDRISQASAMPGWSDSLLLSIHNHAAVPLLAGYTVRYTLDTSNLIGQGQMQPDCDDLRIAYNDGTTETELDRVLEGCNTSATVVLFRSQAEIAVGGDGGGYRLYYGNPDAAPAPANPGNVYAFYDDFQDGNADGWNPAKGNWAVFNDSGNYAYRYCTLTN
jgi:hypothetical protein